MIVSGMPQASHLLVRQVRNFKFSAADSANLLFEKKPRTLRHQVLVLMGQAPPVSLDAVPSLGRSQLPSSAFTKIMRTSRSLTISIIVLLRDGARHKTLDFLVRESNLTSLRGRAGRLRIRVCGSNEPVVIFHTWAKMSTVTMRIKEFVDNAQPDPDHLNHIHLINN
jgi:hypothetical protein